MLAVLKWPAGSMAIFYKALEISRPEWASFSIFAKLCWVRKWTVPGLG